MIKWVLASKSPRRKELMEKLGVSFEIQPSVGEETIVDTDPEKVVVSLAEQKAQEVALLYMNIMDAQMSSTVQWMMEERNQEYSKEMNQKVEGYMIVGADTIVAHEGAILGKPKDRDEAIAMLEKLSGKTHQVYTGVSLILISEKGMDTHSFYEKTDVTFYPLRYSEILDYEKTKSCYDKAGGYGIQDDKFSLYVKKIDGDYNNVVGLPIAKLYQETRRMFPLVFLPTGCSCGKEGCTCDVQGLVKLSKMDFDE